MTPDVTVIIPAYNSVPYVTRCLESVIAQTLAQERIEIIAVDDGSTDGTGEEFERFARERVNLRVIHQPNSGGPSRPRNAGLDVATGRYVFFLDADDYLNTESLERLVRAGDEHGSDVVLGRQIGEGGRRAPRSMFTSTQPATDVFHSRAWWCMNPMKLFRRELIEELGVRFPEAYHYAEDQPFSGRIYLAARVITILADYDYVFFTWREDNSNITLSDVSLDTHLRGLSEMLDLVSSSVEPGADRDLLLTFPFEIEFFRTLRTMATSSDEGENRLAFDQLATWVAELYSYGVVRDLSPAHRVAYRLLVRRDFARTMALMKRVTANTPWDVHLDGERVFAALPFFRDAEADVPDECFEVTSRVRARYRLDTVEWRGDVLHLEGLAHLDLIPAHRLQTDLVLRAREGDTEFVVPVTRAPSSGVVAEVWGVPFEYDMARFSADIAPGTMEGGSPLPPGLWDLRLRMRAGDLTKEPRIGSERASGIDETVQHRVVPTDSREGTTVASYFTDDFSNLSLDVGFTKHSLKRWFSIEEPTWDPNRPRTLVVRGRLALHGLGTETLRLVLLGDEGARFELAVETAEDTFSVALPIDHLAAGKLLPRGRWKLSVEAAVAGRGFSAEPKVVGPAGGSVRVWRGLFPERVWLSGKGGSAAIVVAAADPIGSLRKRLARVPGQ